MRCVGLPRLGGLSMKLMRTFIAVIACTILVAGPVAAGQRGHHPIITPASHATAPAHSAAPAHPAAPPKAVHTPHAAVVPQRVTSNPALVARLTPLLPSGTTLANAATRFKNQGQFIAALHVSQNLNIPFAQLKTD